MPVDLAQPLQDGLGAMIKRMVAGGDTLIEWQLVLATAMLALLPPALVVLAMQKWFVKGLVDSEK